MNTHIKTIKGTKHLPTIFGRPIEMIKRSINIGTFFNKPIKEKCVQITLSNDNIHLTEVQTKELIKALQKAFNN